MLTRNFNAFDVMTFKQKQSCNKMFKARNSTYKIVKKNEDLHFVKFSYIVINKKFFVSSFYK